MRKQKMKGSTANSPEAGYSAPFTPSIIALQLLQNLILVRENIQVLGKETIVKKLDRYLLYLQEQCENEIEFIDYVTAALGWTYWILSNQERLQAFRNYHVPERPSFPHAYAPKTEILHFCETIEPLIISLQ